MKLVPTLVGLILGLCTGLFIIFAHQETILASAARWPGSAPGPRPRGEAFQSQALELRVIARAQPPKLRRTVTPEQAAAIRWKLKEQLATPLPERSESSRKAAVRAAEQAATAANRKGLPSPPPRRMSIYDLVNPVSSEDPLPSPTVRAPQRYHGTPAMQALPTISTHSPNDGPFPSPPHEDLAAASVLTKQGAAIGFINAATPVLLGPRRAEPDANVLQSAKPQPVALRQTPFQVKPSDAKVAASASSYGSEPAAPAGHALAGGAQRAMPDKPGQGLSVRQHAPPQAWGAPEPLGSLGTQQASNAVPSSGHGEILEALGAPQDELALDMPRGPQPGPARSGASTPTAMPAVMARGGSLAHGGAASPSDM